MGDNLGAVEADVPFDRGGADQLIGQYRATARTIEDSRGPRLTEGEHALVDWKGPHSIEFRSRQRQADADACEITRALLRSAALLEEMCSAAEEEQRRRVQAREYRQAVEQNATRSTADIGDRLTTEGIMTGDKPLPPMPPPERDPPRSVSPIPFVGSR